MAKEIQVGGNHYKDLKILVASYTPTNIKPN